MTRVGSFLVDTLFPVSTFVQETKILVWKGLHSLIIFHDGSMERTVYCTYTKTININ